MPDMRTSVWAEALAHPGDRERASKEASRALEQAREHGYRAIERRADAVLERFEIEVSERA